VISVLDHLLDASTARSVYRPPPARLAAIDALDGVMIRRYGEALWIVVAEIEDDAIIGSLVSDPQHSENAGLSFRDRVACQRHHVVALAPWQLLSVEQRDRIKDDAITAENRRWKKQLIKALNGAGFAVRLQRAAEEELARKRKQNAHKRKQRVELGATVKW
jgi:hypothetical protein